MRFLALIFLTLNVCFALELKTPKGGAFTLQTTEGKLSSEDLKGKKYFLFFGFTRCPNVCPLTLRRMKTVSEKLSSEERKNFRFIFISVDTERDDLPQLKALKKIYGDSYIGATGTDKELTELAASYGARFRRFKTKRGKLIVDHTDSVFHIDKEGNWTATIPHPASVEEMLTILRMRTVKVSSVHPERSAKLLAKVENCNLSEKACTAVINGESFTLEFSPRPVSSEKKFRITLKTNAKEHTPKEIDFEGITLNMGYLRPELQKTGEGLFTRDYTLPVCELPRMDWRVRLIVVTKSGEWGFIDYFLSTFE